MSSMSHTRDIDTIGGSYASKFEESPLSDNLGGVGGQNCIPHLINHSTNLSSNSNF
jgi:hypothetical protein